jgi:CRP-like cAMP-binding protein
LLAQELAQCRLALLPLRVGERAGGMFVVLALIGAADDDALVSGAPVAVSISELARRIGSSRTHVIMLLNDAAADGLVDRSSGNGIVLLPRLSEAATNSSPSGICSSRIAQRLYGRGM